MKREMAGGECEFLKENSKSLLRTTGFGSRKTRGRESSLHSHLGEDFILDWSINMQRAKLQGVRFTAIIDCYALMFILSYDGPNTVILRLQMRLMLFNGLLSQKADFFDIPRLSISFRGRYVL